MKLDIRDAAAVRAIRPLDAALYLRALGWTRVSAPLPTSSVWMLRVNGDEYEALLPMSQDVGDYALRMGDLLRVLSAAEHRPQTEIYTDLLTTTFDITRIRISDPDLSTGTLPIEEHAQIAQKARDLVLAAACAATEPRPVWHTRKPNQAVEHVRKVRIGQSERGSYVITVLSPVAPLLHAPDDPLFEVEPPFERQVSQTLARSLAALNSAAEQAALTQEMSSFDEAVPLGVNANLCDAVIGLWGGEELRRSLEFTFSWSPARPIDGKTPRRVAFSADRVPMIREAGRLMRERATVPDFELRGPVVKLEKAEGAIVGKATVVGLLDGRQVRVTLELKADEYQRALDAHREGQIIEVAGTLTKQRRSFTLTAPRELTVVEE